VDITKGNQIVTVIEVLSPWNKRAGKLNRKYVRMLRDFEASGTNWVEIDLLRGSRNRLTVSWKDMPAQDRADYLATTYRADDESVSAYPISIRQPLPTMLIPLRDTDGDFALNLQEALDRVYLEGRFSSADYSKPPVPPLREQEAEWAAELIASHSTKPE